MASMFALAREQNPLFGSFYSCASNLSEMDMRLRNVAGAVSGQGIVNPSSSRQGACQTSPRQLSPDLQGWQP